MLGEPRVVADGVDQRVAEALLDVGQVLARVGRDPDLEHALLGHARGPVASADDADVVVERVRDAGELRVAELVAVGGGLDLDDRVDHPRRGDDRVLDLGGALGVRTLAVDGDARPHDADLRLERPVAERLRDDGRVARVAAVEGGERAVARALLLDHRDQAEVAAEAHAGVPQGARGEDHRRDAGLHVRGAATPHAAVGDLGRPRVTASSGARASAGTTSMWPWKTSERPPSPAASRRAPTFGRPANDHSTGP